MDRENGQKRGREEARSDVRREKKPRARDLRGGGGGGAAGGPPPGVFEFPWGSAVVDPGSDGFCCDFHDVFFSSLVDGRSAVAASIGVPGDTLMPVQTGPIWFCGDGEEKESWPSDGETDGGDCIWSCPLSQPLFAGPKRGVSNA
ncbi:hypothetical protein QJS10_CPB15g01145 [Acorus calamus]|uniref:Uncharacterized protein n=1 Tax=Acorus calamus TaxID=4465 RepID=A0AAV9D7U6_ACOCL|nr:hypothetical protein QJS10_CPB15g01145 [Acorus calamus]